ncbi:hypothetical protein NEMIN01_0276 [Nematocida minor]|uniref:uncharacterized protein n=1 Tax=Nematocida minor TaxID=1912983 RepID=UPI00221FDDB0|nr:uncharacterized protein NEMIN01_0276 [Nematocida minor]KAI5189110.1 hypothetical protein NEMIN01_0276 [Nematocida minor]
MHELSDIENRVNCMIEGACKRIRDPIMYKTDYLKRVQEIINSSNISNIKTSLKECTLFMSMCTQDIVSHLEYLSTPESDILCFVFRFNTKIIMQEIMEDYSVVLRILDADPDKKYDVLLRILTEKCLHWFNLYSHNLSLYSGTEEIEKCTLLTSKLSIVYVNKMTIFNKSYWEDLLEVLEKNLQSCHGFEEIEKSTEKDFKKLLNTEKTLIQILNELLGYSNQMIVKPIENNCLNKDQKKNISMIQALIENWSTFPFIQDNVHLLQEMDTLDMVSLLDNFESAGFLKGMDRFLGRLKIYKDSLSVSLSQIPAHSESIDHVSPENIANLKKFTLVQDMIKTVNKTAETIHMKYNTMWFELVVRDTCLPIILFLLFFGAQSAYWAGSTAVSMMHTHSANNEPNTLEATFVTLSILATILGFFLSVIYLEEFVPKRKYVFLLSSLLLVLLYGGSAFLMSLVFSNKSVGAFFLWFDNLALFLFVLASLGNIYSSMKLNRHIHAWSLFIFTALVCIFWETLFVWQICDAQILVKA